MSALIAGHSAESNFQTKSCVHAGNIFSTRAKQKVCLEVRVALSRMPAFYIHVFLAGSLCLASKAEFVSICKLAKPMCFLGRGSVAKGDIQVISFQNFSKGKNNIESAATLGDRRHLNIADILSSDSVL